MSALTTGLPLLYRPDKAIVWVEDSLTEQYLAELWQDTGIVFHVGGGNQTIRAATHDAQLHGSPNVVGIVDRDFGVSNFPQWLNPASQARVLVIQVHEVENYLLDENALAGCALNTHARTAAQIANYLRNTAGLCEWQFAASGVVARWSSIVRDGFPDHPNRQEAHDQVSSLAYLQGSQWYTDIINRAQLVTAPGEPAASLIASHAQSANFLTGARWKVEFPGKEMFKDVRGYIYEPVAIGAPATGGQPDIDVAKSVAAWQRANGGVPAELQTLQAVIHMKAGV